VAARPAEHSLSEYWRNRVFGCTSVPEGVGLNAEMNSGQDS
jgi:hypothetical protein